MKGLLKGLPLLCALTASAAASAQEVGHWYLTPQVGGYWSDNERPVEDHDWLWGLAIGKHVSEGLSIELNLNGTELGGGPAGSDHTIYGGSLDFLGVLDRTGLVSPYLSLGLGVAQLDRDPGPDASDFMAQAGIGFFWKLWESGDGARTFSLRPDVKLRWIDAGSPGNFIDYLATIGFQFSFGAPKAPPPAPEPEPTPPPPAPAPAPPPPPAAPADSDGDGVTDDIDRCPDTPRGVAVDATGCPQRGSITLEGVTFELNSAQLTAESFRVLDEVAAQLMKYPRLRIELQGHTDSTGPDDYNLALSQKRAEAVRDYLISRGVAASQLTARGLGEAQPIDDNRTREGRARNRRVVMFVLENPGDVDVSGEGSVEQTAPPER